MESAALQLSADDAEDNVGGVDEGDEDPTIFPSSAPVKAVKALKPVRRQLISMPDDDVDDIEQPSDECEYINNYYFLCKCM